MMSFCGIDLSDSDSSDVGPWITENLKPDQLFPIAYRSWPGYLTYGPILNNSAEEPTPVKIGSLFWPWGASRFARGHFVVTTEQVEKIRKKVFKGGVPISSDFIFDDLESKIVTKLWMLPCIPLSKAAEGLGMYLLTLVDDRYWWWGTQVSLTVTAGSTAWIDLYSSIGSALELEIEVDPVADDYHTPPTDYAAKSIEAPALLDAIAFSVGQRIVRNFDGSVKAQNFTTAEAILTANQASDFVPYAGGEFDFDPRS